MEKSTRTMIIPLKVQFRHLKQQSPMEIYRFQNDKPFILYCLIERLARFQRLAGRFSVKMYVIPLDRGTVLPHCCLSQNHLFLSKVFLRGYCYRSCSCNCLSLFRARSLSVSAPYIGAKCPSHKHAGLCEGCISLSNAEGLYSPKKQFFKK